ncbi:AMP-binding protein [Erythrobacter tepidarius]|uniref:AMP-binding protein n=1 Tax=Erythrobacter tepidarius TaxID=60454 RepID=UPI000A372680|nr:AMP-binding protein [Erythrobacter tepidarius]
MPDGAMQDFALTLDRILDHAARWHPDTEVVTATPGESQRIGYAQLNARARRVSAVLAERGVAQGSRVATLAWNTQAHVESWYAIMGMGAVCHTLNPRLTADQLAWMAGQSRAGVLIASADLAGLASDISARTPTLRHVLIIDGAAEIGEALEPLLVRSNGEEVVWGQFDETLPCGLCFTSGTTGAPKGVTYTHRGNFLHTLRQLQADVAGITSRDVVLPVVPMFHANAWGLPFAAPATGAKLVLPGRHTDGASLARLIAAEGVTIAVGVPTVWLGLIDHLDAVGGEVPSLQRIMVGGAPMPPALMERLEARGIEVQTTWGMTELSPLGTATPPGAMPRDPAQSGRPAIGMDLLLTDHKGTPLPEQRGAEGHLWVRGPSVVERYFGKAELATRDGWFETGDLATIDDEGNLRITGRAKDLIKSGGEWINPAEIEALVGALPEVSLAAVIGRPDAKWGERPILLVELRDDASPSDEALCAPLHGKVASWWIPDAVVRLDKMPLAATGKIDKLRLRNQYSRP